MFDYKQSKYYLKKDEKDSANKSDISNDKIKVIVAQSPDCHSPYQNPKKQTHNHEFLGSTKLAELTEDPHNHRFAGVTSEVIPKDGDHVHAILVNTDYFNHYHEVGIIITGPSIPVDCLNDQKHIHFVEGITTKEDGHTHKFEFATLINSPLV